MIEGESESIDNPLSGLEKQEAALWHKVELEIHRNAVLRVGADASSIDLLHAHEDSRKDVNVIAKTIGELTPIVLKIILIQNPGIQMDALAEQLGAALKERIDFHFRPHEISQKPAGSVRYNPPETD